MKKQSYLKGKYEKIEFSDYELMMIILIVNNYVKRQEDFFTETNLNDLREYLNHHIPYE